MSGFEPTASRGKPSNNFYNAMVAPLANISLAGAIYYQGLQMIQTYDLQVV